MSLTTTRGISHRWTISARLAKDSGRRDRTVGSEPLLQVSIYETTGKRRRCQRPTVLVLHSVLIADQRVQGH